MLTKDFKRLLELIDSMPMPVYEVDEEKREIIVKNVDGTIGYVLENYSEDELRQLNLKINKGRVRNEREEKAIVILEEFLSDEIDIRGYDAYFQLYDFIEEEFYEKDRTVTGTMILCVDGYKIEMDIMVDLLSDEVYVYQAEDYQKCSPYSKVFIVELIASVINSVKYNVKCGG